MKKTHILSKINKDIDYYADCIGWTGKLSGDATKVLPSPQIVSIFWGSFYDSHPEIVTATNQCLSDLVSGPYMNGLGQYGVGQGNLAQTFSTPEGSPNPLSGDQIESHLDNWIKSGKIIGPAEHEKNLLYFVFTPAGVNITLSDGSSTDNPDSKKRFSGYHDWGRYNKSVGSMNLFWAVIPLSYIPEDPVVVKYFMNGFTQIIAHELAEASTDCDSGFQNKKGCECSDVCIDSNFDLRVGEWYVEPYWSNEDQMCIGGHMAWESLEELGSTALSSAPCTVSWDDGRLDVFSKTSDGDIQHLWYAGVWQQWESLGKPNVPYFSDPTVCSWGPNHLALLVIGSDGALWLKSYLASGVNSTPVWYNWVSLNKPTAFNFAIGKSPSACSWGNNNYDIFVLGSDGAIWHKWVDADEYGFSRWKSRGKPDGVDIVSSPVAVAYRGSKPDAGRIDIFVRGSDNALWHKYYGTENDDRDTGWKNSFWESLGSIPGTPSNSAISACSWDLGRLDVFAQTGNEISHKRYADGTWHDWESLGGDVVSAPAAASWGPNRIDLFALQNPNSGTYLWHKYYQTDWYP